MFKKILFENIQQYSISFKYILIVIGWFECPIEINMGSLSIFLRIFNCYIGGLPGKIIDCIYFCIGITDLKISLFLQIFNVPRGIYEAGINNSNIRSEIFHLL